MKWLERAHQRSDSPTHGFSKLLVDCSKNIVRFAPTHPGNP